ncbi:DUF3021 domain-containing protein [Halalkalibacter akibai]|uniref:DUF3021 domain-containing protein n=1 Tax=Halalkalibacter akibai TaxID=1411 RepID=UPI000554122F|nr:DUF3021 domain-containing protein [Halalkalibacter akibai]
MIEAVRRSILGLGFSAVFTFVALTIMMLQDVQVSVSIIWMNMLGSMVMGIYFGVSSMIFDVDHWSPLKQTTIHFLLSISVWLPLAMLIGWLPFNVIPIIVGIGSFIVVYVIFWSGSYFYFKRLEHEMNQSVKR